MPKYLERFGGEIAGVNVSRRLNVPLAMLQMAMLLDGEPYRMHPLGGGLVADSSFVPDSLAIPHDIRIGPGTHVLTDKGMAGQLYIKGNLKNPNQVSREIDEEGLMLLQAQRELGVVGRVMEIDRRMRMGEASAALDALATL